MSIEMTHILLMTKGPDANEFQVEEDDEEGNKSDSLNFGNCVTRFEFYFLNIYFFI